MDAGKAVLDGGGRGVFRESVAIEDVFVLALKGARSLDKLCPEILEALLLIGAVICTVMPKLSGNDITSFVAFV